MTAQTPPTGPQQSTAGRRFGYVIAAGINAALLYAVNNVLSWDQLRFLTDGFEEVIPIISVSLTATLIMNLIYVFYDPRWFKSLSQIGLAGISIAATVRLYQVFPFDFSKYDFSWETLTRVVLIVAIVGMAITIVAETFRLVGAIVHLKDPSEAGTRVLRPH